MKNLGDIFGGAKRLAYLGLASAMIIYPSCESMDFVSALFDIASTSDKLSPGQKRDAALMSKWTGKEGDRQFEERISKENKSEINVNVIENKDSKLEDRLDEYYLPSNFKFISVVPPASFTATDYKDLDGSGHITKDEIQLKNCYDCANEVKLLGGSSWFNAKGKSITMKVSMAGSGEILFVHDAGKITQDGEVKGIYFTFKKAGNNGVKEYSLDWMVDGRVMPTRNVRFFVNYNSQNNSTSSITETKKQVIEERKEVITENKNIIIMRKEGPVDKKEETTPKIKYKRDSLDAINFEIYSSWKDYNENNVIETRELTKFGDGIYHLNRGENVQVCFSADKAGYVKFETYKVQPLTGNQETLNRKESYYPGDKEAVIISPSFDKSGTYKIKAFFESEQGTKKNISLEFKVVK